MPYKDPEKRKEYQKKYNQQLKINNPDKVEQYKQNGLENKREYMRNYIKTEEGKKYKRIRTWKNSGIIHDDFDTVYDIYINTNVCDFCKVELTEGRGMNCRCLDHNHETGEIRGILCKNCNLKDVLAKLN